jgi:NADH-quinone oxidoreductase subunit D
MGRRAAEAASGREPGSSDMPEVDTQNTQEGMQTEEMLLNMGPQHPSTHGVLRLLLRMDGEIVHDVVPYIGYLHRCKEKIGQSVNYTQFVPYTDRLDYLASMNMNFGYVQAVEKMLGVEVPERAQYLRVIMAELNRIASHLVSWGTFGLDMGAFTPFMYGFRERERIIDIFEKTCGARLTYNYMRIGGVSRDIPNGLEKEIVAFLDYFEPRIPEYNDLLSYNKIFVERTANVGVLPLDLAVAYGVTGPCLRASGLKWDCRKDDPYSIYDRFDFEIPVGAGEMGTVGDAWDRYMVRIHEMEQSARIVRQAVEALPGGDTMGKVSKTIKTPKDTELYFRTEAPKGEIGFYIISNGTAKPQRLKIRSPSFSNLSVLPEIARGAMVADLVAIVASLDIVLGEIDR